MVTFPGRGSKVSHAAGQLRLGVTTTEPAHSRAHAPQTESGHHSSPRSGMPQKRSHVPQLRSDAAK